MQYVAGHEAELHGVGGEVVAVGVGVDGGAGGGGGIAGGGDIASHRQDVGLQGAEGDVRAVGVVAGRSSVWQEVSMAIRKQMAARAMKMLSSIFACMVESSVFISFYVLLVLVIVLRLVPSGLWLLGAELS
ncbi:MAG: hypothetical protein LUE99_17500 [Bacteroides sp.]|nr:hypothetical protein [Bacteroides sp.]